MLDILLEDNALIAVAKPAGLLTQAPLGIDSLEFRIKRYLQQSRGVTSNVYLGVPHRLDRPVSGAILFAKNVRAARRISEQFEGRLVEKTYWALVTGHVEPNAGTWTDFLQKVEGEPRSIVVDERHPAGKLAILHYRVVAAFQLPAAEGGSQGPATLLEIQLETGRTHQIRVQGASRGHPLLGDQLYGSSSRFGPWSDDERERLIALHARSLRLNHPMTREPLNLVAPLPNIWPPVAGEA
jgi:23S rRNA pseudouridine1911/1915/1917 synthase